MRAGSRNLRLPFFGIPRCPHTSRQQSRAHCRPPGPIIGGAVGTINEMRMEQYTGQLPQQHLLRAQYVNVIFRRLAAVHIIRAEDQTPVFASPSHLSTAAGWSRNSQKVAAS